MSSPAPFPPPPPSAPGAGTSPSGDASTYSRRGPAWPRLALAQLADGLVVADAAGRVTYANPAAERLHGTSRLAVAGAAGAESGAGGDYAVFTEAGAPYPPGELPLARAALRGEAVHDARWRIRRADGTEVLAVGTATPLTAADGRPAGAVLTVRDDTARAADAARHEAELAAAADALARANHDLADREARWHTLAEAMPQLVWTSRADGYSDYSNERWLEYTGQRQEETWGLGWMDVMHPDDRAPTLAAWEPSVARGEPFESYYRLRRAADGEYRWFLARAVPQRDARGAVTRWFGTCTDVHDARALVAERERLLAGERAARAEAEAAARRADFLARASDLLGGSLDVAPTLRQVAALAVPALADWCALDLVGPDGRFERLAVCHPDPAMVRLAYELDERYPEDPASPHGRYNVLRTGEAEMMVDIPDALLVAACRDAEHLRIARALQLRSYVAAPVAGRDRVLGVLTLVYAESGRRYTEADRQLAVELARRAAQAIENARLVDALSESRHQLEEQAVELELQKEELQATAEELALQSERAEQARAVAEEANRAKTQFLATMSHELRTPLNAIGGYADLLTMGLRGPLSDAQRADIGRIRRSGQHLLGLINDILNFAKLEAGQVEFRPAAFDADAVVREVEPLLLPQVEAKGLAYTTECADPAPRVYADPEKVRQVLLNLLTNAVKFTDAGGAVSLACAPCAPAGAPGGAAVCFTVRDTGRGIPADRMESIFEPFVQVDRHLTAASQQGVGLGLAISRDLARAMGGDLTAESAPGAGSAFRLVLPAARGPDA